MELERIDVVAYDAGGVWKVAIRKGVRVLLVTAEEATQISISITSEMKTMPHQEVFESLVPERLRGIVAIALFEMGALASANNLEIIRAAQTARLQPYQFLN